MYALRVENMRCGGCAARVTEVVRSLDSQAKVDVDLAHKTVRIGSQADPNAVAAAVSAAGYPARTTEAV